MAVTSIPIRAVGAGAWTMPELDLGKAWVAAARSGDRAAFGQLYQRHAAMVQAVILVRVPRDAAADLVHDVFLNAMRRLDTLRDDGAFAPWLASMARHRAIDWLRRQRPTVPLEDEHLPSVPPTSDDEARALAAVQTLPEAYRETLLLRYAAGLTGPEIAERTGMTPGSVRVNLHRGVQLLRNRWRGERDA